VLVLHQKHKLIFFLEEGSSTVLHYVANSEMFDMLQETVLLLDLVDETG
jgi:hypothetical protein